LKLERSNWTVTFVWVKAHVGILGNEMADHQAKTAARDEDMTTSFSRIPLSTLFWELEEESKLKWQQNLEDSSKAAQTKQLYTVKGMQCPTPRAEADPASPTHKQVRIARHIIVCSVTSG
jgi:hypothetical protein